MWTISASPYNKEVFACGSHSIKEGTNQVNVFDISQVAEASKDFNKKHLKTKLTLGESVHQSNIHSVVWEDSEPNEGMQAKELISADFEKIFVWDINKGEQTACIESSYHGESNDTINVVKRDPHHKNIICMGLEQGFTQIDLRSPTNKSASQKIAHSDLLTDLDYNPNKLNTLATCGQDSFLRFWDLRKLDRCLLEFEDDSHWLNCVKYNRFHDQLLISGTSSTFL